MAISSNATGLRPGVVTSTTRPTTPYTGQIIYETDTGYLRVWDGSAWDYFSPKQDTIPGAWTTWTPTLTATTTNPTLGSGSVQEGYYTVVNKLVVAHGYVAFGTSASAGSGDYRMSLPVTAARTAAANAGSVWLYDASTASGWSATAQIQTTTTAGFNKSTSGATIVISNSNPFTWADNDQIRAMFIYEAA